MKEKDSSLSSTGQTGPFLIMSCKGKKDKKGRPAVLRFDPSHDLSPNAHTVQFTFVRLIIVEMYFS